MAAQMEAFGKTGNELAAYNEKTKTPNQLQAAGVPITDAMRSNAAALEQEYAAARKQLDDFRERQADLVRTMDDVRDAGRGFPDPLVQAGLHGTSIMAGLRTGLESVASKLAGKLEDSLMDTVLGAKGTSGGGLFGGGLPSFLGTSARLQPLMKISSTASRQVGARALALAGNTSRPASSIAANMSFPPSTFRRT